MLVDIVAVKVVGKHQLWLEFEDGIKGTLDVSKLFEFTGIFEQLKDQEQFAQVQLDVETGVIYWPNGADLDSDVLYSKVSGKPLPKFEIEKIASA